MEDYRLDFRLSEASCVALAGAKHRTEAVRTSENSVNAKFREFTFFYEVGE